MSKTTRNLEKAISAWLDDLEEPSTDRTTSREERDGPSQGSGRLALRNGQILMEKPEKNGPWPVIVPGEHARLSYRDKVLKQPTVIENVEFLQVEAINESPQSDFQLVISADKMSVTLKTHFKPGAEYRLLDESFTHRLVVKTVLVREIKPRPIDEELVLSRLQNMGISGEILYDQITAACRELVNGEAVIVKGKPPIPPLDGRVEVVCELESKDALKSNDQKVNFLDKQVINSVEPGDVLAFWHPPRFGQPGRNVFGEEVAPPAPRHPQLLVGPGVRVINNGEIAVAEIAGRPKFENNRLSVCPQLVVPGDVDVVTGNIEFKGDVIVLGNVAESLTVRAGGAIEVKGSVYHARLIAGGNVTIQKNLIGGSVTAGGEKGNYVKIAALLKQLCPILVSLGKAVAQLKEHPRFSVADLEIRGDGCLVKLILEMRFPNVPELFAELYELLPEQEPNPALEKAVRVLRAVAKRFMGAGPLEIKAIEEIGRYQEYLARILAHLDEMLEEKANISVYYCQKAQLTATGSITVTGPLVYGCDMGAGTFISIAGECRSGCYTAGEFIQAQSVGSKGIVKTKLAVEVGGFLSAQVFHPDVQLRIGSAYMITPTAWHKVKVRFVDGEWKTTHGE